MKTTDKFLIAIVGGIVLLVGVAFVVAVVRPKPGYQPDDTPEGVAYNYVLALRQSDYERAYGYLSPDLPGYPSSVQKFQQDVSNFNSGQDQSVTLAAKANYVSGDSASVTVSDTTFNSGGLFGSSQYTQNTNLSLVRSNGQWKLVESEWPYWAFCWSNVDGC